MPSESMFFFLRPFESIFEFALQKIVILSKLIISIYECDWLQQVISSFASFDFISAYRVEF